jgi:hypothetical protein
MRTIFKQKIGSHLSYPLKVSELEEQLLPALDERGTDVRFSAYKASRKNETRSSYPLIEASYNPSEYDRWTLTVFPVPRPVREAVRVQLLPALAHNMKAWLAANHADGWFATYHSLRCQFETASETLTFQEHNSF